MVSIHIRVNCPKENILSRMFQYREIERHHMFEIAGLYHSGRRGMHTYICDDKVTGYWETGEVSRGCLLKSKVWLSLKVSEQDGCTIIKGIVIFQPIDILVFFLVYISTLFTESFSIIATTTVVSALAVFLLGKKINGEVKEVVSWLEKLCKQAEDENNDSAITTD